MRWVITGGCGFIGTRLIRCLREKGEQVRAFDNLSVGTAEDLESVSAYQLEERPQGFGSAQEPVQLVMGDIRDPLALECAFHQADAVVHLAAQTGVLPSVESPTEDCETNVLGVVRALEAARAKNVERFIFASSGAPLGEQSPPIDELKLPKPLSPYGASKLAGEAYCHVYGACFGLKTVALRFGNVYGAGCLRKGSVVARFIKQALAGETLVIYGDGKQTRDFIYVDDLVDAIWRARNLERGGELFQIATGGETTVNEIARLLDEELSRRGIRANIEYQAPRAGEVLRNYSDISKAREVLGWSPNHSLEEGIRETVDWFLRRDSGVA